MYNPIGTRANGTVSNRIVPGRPVADGVGILCDPLYSGAGRKFGTIAGLVPSLRRPQILQVLLVLLSEGIRVPEEVIVIENDPKSSACPEPIPGLPLHTFHAALDLSRARARNVSWRSATSDLCVFIDDDNVVEQEAIDQLALVFEDVGVGFAGHLIYAGDQGINWWTVVSLGRTMVRAPMSDGAERARRMARHRIRFHVPHYRGLPQLSALGIFIPIWIIVTTAECLCADVAWRIR